MRTDIRRAQIFGLTAMLPLVAALLVGGGPPAMAADAGNLAFGGNAIFHGAHRGQAIHVPVVNDGDVVVRESATDYETVKPSFSIHTSKKHNTFATDLHSASFMDNPNITQTWNGKVSDQSLLTDGITLFGVQLGNLSTFDRSCKLLLNLGVGVLLEVRDTYVIEQAFCFGFNNSGPLEFSYFPKVREPFFLNGEEICFGDKSTYVKRSAKCIFHFRSPDATGIFWQSITDGIRSDNYILALSILRGNFFDEVKADAEYELSLLDQDREVIQSALTAAGFYHDSRYKGGFDQSIRESIAAFQLNIGTIPTGLIDNETHGKLLALYNDSKDNTNPLRGVWSSSCEPPLNIIKVFGDRVYYILGRLDNLEFVGRLDQALRSEFIRLSDKIAISYERRGKYIDIVMHDEKNSANTRKRYELISVDRLVYIDGDKRITLRRCEGVTLATADTLYSLSNLKVDLASYEAMRESERGRDGQIGECAALFEYVLSRYDLSGDDSLRLFNLMSKLQNVFFSGEFNAGLKAGRIKVRQLNKSRIMEQTIVCYFQSEFVLQYGR